MRYGSRMDSHMLKYVAIDAVRKLTASYETATCTLI
jgi:hypothetical protein